MFKSCLKAARQAVSIIFVGAALFMGWSQR
jgi:hypothetical protein